MKTKALLYAWKLSVLGIMAVLFVPWIAHSGGSKTQSELRFISPTDATSDCIGNPITPLCAVETFKACALRLEPELCRMVGIEKYLFNKTQNSSEYYVVSTHTITAEDITEELRNSDWIKPGFVDITILEPDFRMDWCPNGCKTSYILKPVGDFWHVASYSVWGAP